MVGLKRWKNWKFRKSLFWGRPTLISKKLNHIWEKAVFFLPLWLTRTSLLRIDYRIFSNQKSSLRILKASNSPPPPQFQFPILINLRSKKLRINSTSFTKLTKELRSVRLKFKLKAWKTSQIVRIKSLSETQ